MSKGLLVLYGSLYPVEEDIKNERLHNISSIQDLYRVGMKLSKIGGSNSNNDITNASTFFMI